MIFAECDFDSISLSQNYAVLIHYDKQLRRSTSLLRLVLLDLSTILECIFLFHGLQIYDKMINITKVDEPML